MCYGLQMYSSELFKVVVQFPLFISLKSNDILVHYEFHVANNGVISVFFTLEASVFHDGLHFFCFCIVLTVKIHNCTKDGGTWAEHETCLQYVVFLLAGVTE